MGRLEKEEQEAEQGAFTEAHMEEELEGENKELGEEIKKLLTEKNKDFPEVTVDNSGADAEEAKQKIEEEAKKSAEAVLAAVGQDGELEKADEAAKADEKPDDAKKEEPRERSR